MQDVDTPLKLPAIWAASAGGGYIVYPVPTPSQVGITNGAASFTTGFPPNNFIAYASGGAGPFGTDFNGILKQITAGVQWLQAGGPIKYDSVFSSAITGYPNGAIISSDLSVGGVLGKLWISEVDNNTSDPDTGGANWLAGYIANNTTPLPVPAGGTGDITFTLGAVLLGNNTSPLLQAPPVSSGYVLTDNGVGVAPTFKAASGGGTISPASSVRLSASLVTAAASVTFTADQIVVASAPGGATTVLTSFSEVLNISTTGAGGMDTGSPAINTFVGIYAIHNPTTVTSALLATAFGASDPTLTYTGANMPAGYTQSSLLAVWLVDGSSLMVAGNIVDRQFTHFTNIQLINGGTSSAASLLLAGDASSPFNGIYVVPVAARTVILLVECVEPSTVGSDSAGLINSVNDFTGPQIYVTAEVVGSPGGKGTGSVPLVTPQTIYYSSRGGAGAQVSVNVVGYTI